MSAKPNIKLSFSEKFAYGLGDCSANIVVALTGTFLSAYYTDTVGIAAAAVGTMLLLCRVLDGGSDLLMGALVDRTTSKYGKARPWMLWTAPLMAIGIYVLFNCPDDLSEHGKLVYVYLTYIFMMVIVYTAKNLPFNALLSRMTLDVQDRASAAAMRFVMTQITAIITNPDYAAVYEFSAPEGFAFKAVGLLCGTYRIDLPNYDDEVTMPLIAEYLPNGGTVPEMEAMNLFKHITEKFPAVFVATGTGDFLRIQLHQLVNALVSKDIPFCARYYTSPDEDLGHDFCCNVNLKTDHECAEDMCAFFRKYVKN